MISVATPIAITNRLFSHPRLEFLHLGLHRFVSSCQSLPKHGLGKRRAVVH